MNCPKCERPVPVGANICEACLASFDDAGDEVQRVFEPPVESRRPRPRKRPSTERPAATRRRAAPGADDETPLNRPSVKRRPAPAEGALEETEAEDLAGVCFRHPTAPVVSTCDVCSRLVCIRCVPRLEKDDDSTCTDCAAETKPQALPIGGWLYLPAIGLVLRPLLMVVGIVALLALGGGDPELDISGQLAFLVTMCACYVITAVFFFLRKRAATLLYVSLLLLDMLGTYLFPSDPKDLAGTIFWNSIWILYFFMSNRVRKTFIVP